MAVVGLKHERRVILLRVLLSGFLVLLRFPAVAFQSVTLGWDASPNATVIGYNVYFGTVSGSYSHKVSVLGVTQASISGLVENTTYYFAVTAVNRIGLESVPSNEVCYTVPGLALSLGRIPAVGYSGAFSVTSTGVIPSSWALEASVALNTWSTLATGTNSLAQVIVAVSGSPAMFFRLNSGSSGVRLSVNTIQPDRFPKSVLVTSAGTIPSQWTLEWSKDLRAWSTLAGGTNSPVNATIVISTAPAMFFRLKAF